MSSKPRGILKLEEAFQDFHISIGHKFGYTDREHYTDCPYKACTSFREALRELEAELAIPS